MKKNTAIYLFTLLIFGIAMWAVLTQGKLLEHDRTAVRALTQSVPSVEHPGFFSNLMRNAEHPLAVMIIQIFCIMIAARVFAFLMIKIGQPAVVGEIMAGIALGPSLMGMLFPEFSAFLFPEESLRRLHVLSQIGLVLFMFIIGMELDLGILKKKARATIVISYVSVIFPFLLGVFLAYVLYASFGAQDTPFSTFAMFIGIAMSITAFPVLARIIQERNQTQTPAGIISIAAAAANDIVGWFLLALVVAIVGAGGMLSAVGSLVLSVIYVFCMWFVIRPILHRIAIKYDTPESINKSVMSVVFGILLMSSYLTEIIGIHALFGAFLAGLIMPPQKEFKRIISEKIEDISLVLFLPLFFVFTGLKTQIGLLNQPYMWGFCLLIIGVAVFGKFFGTFIAAKFTGQNWRDSLLIGALMNTRGLMELVVLNIGYDLGVISTEIFTMMVLMALATTFMTGPAINIIEFFAKRHEKKQVQPPMEGFNALLSFGSPLSGSRLLKLAYYLNLKNEKDSSVTAIHFSPSADISLIEAEQYEKEAFEPILRAADRLQVSLRKLFRVTDHMEKEILEMLNENPFDIMLMGSSRDLFKGDKVGGVVKTILEDTKLAVGVLIDKEFKKIERAAMILSNGNDLFLLKYAKRYLLEGAEKNLTIMDRENQFASPNEILQFPGLDMKGNFTLMGKAPEKNANLAKKYDLVIVSLEFWESLKREEGPWLARMPSVFIINR